MPVRLPQLAMLAAAILFLPAGCDRPLPPPDDGAAGSRAPLQGGAVPPAGAPAELAHPLPLEEEPAGEPPDLPVATKEPAPEAAAAVAVPPPPPPPAPTPDTSIREASPGAVTAGGAPPARTEPAGRNNARKPPSAGAAPAAPEAAHPEIPIWARDGEELSYKVTFMGVTAGYARLISRGRVRIGGRDAYHILIKAWTTGTLSVLFPISESFDYYLDAETLAPIRRDSVIRKVNRPEIVLFDQEKGTITHWYADTMEVRKKKQIPPPDFYEGVSATYFYRTRGFGDRSVSIRVFGGRKVYRVTTERAGEETIPYENGKVDTYVVKPVYKEEGGSGEKPMVGELLVWVSKDPRRVPVKLYASFRKGLEWKLVGELQSGLAGKH
ncbi:MAG TPA: DUF3108 domain-containing protein [Candidatus Deferrimicrobiaceae bacterium]